MLFKDNRGVPIQLEHSQESSYHDTGESGIRNEFTKCEWLALAKSVNDVGRLLPDADQRRVQVVESDGGKLAGRECQQSQRCEVFHTRRPHQVRHTLAELLFEAHHSGVTG